MDTVTNSVYANTAGYILNDYLIWHRNEATRQFCHSILFWHTSYSEVIFIMLQIFYCSSFRSVFRLFQVSTTWINVSLWYKERPADLPNQELSVLYGGPTLNYGGQLSLYVPYMLRLNMTWDLHTCNCLIYRVKLDLYAERLIYREKECLYAERNCHFPIEIILRK